MHIQIGVDREEDDETFEEKMERLVRQLGKEMAESDKLDEEIRTNLREIGFRIDTKLVS
jgi:type I restriction enzyme M protein